MKKGTWFLWAAMVVGLSSCDKEPSSQVGAIEVRVKPPSEAVEELVYLKDVSERWLVLFGFESEGKWYPKLKGERGVFANRALRPGELFFHDGPMKNRFRFIEMEEREVHNHRLDIYETLHFAIFEDQLPSKKGERYEVPSRLPRAMEHEYLRSDLTALLTVENGDLDSEPFKIGEGARFALPPGAGDQEFFLKSVTPEEIVVEWTEGGGSKLKTIAVSNRAK